MTIVWGLDPSTKTGIAKFDTNSEVQWQQELVELETSKGQVDRARRMVDNIAGYLERFDIVCIEDFAHGAKGDYVSYQYGLGFMIRDMLNSKKIDYYEVSTGQLKNFAGAAGNAKKEDLILPIFKRWGFEHGSDNVRDAYVLARIAEGIARRDAWCEKNLTKQQREIVHAVVDRKNGVVKAKKSRKKP